MKLVKSEETFEVIEFQPEYDPAQGSVKYGAHSLGFFVVSGHDGPEAYLGPGQTVKPGAKFLIGDKGTSRVVTDEQLKQIVDSGEMQMVQEGPERETTQGPMLKEPEEKRAEPPLSGIQNPEQHDAVIQAQEEPHPEQPLSAGMPGTPEALAAIVEGQKPSEEKADDQSGKESQSHKGDEGVQAGGVALGKQAGAEGKESKTSSRDSSESVGPKSKESKK